MTMSGSFFNKINTVPSDDLDKYYLSYHAKNGFDLERKRYSVGFFSKVVTAIFRIWRICTGHSYNFEYNVQKFAECIKKDGITSHDLKACTKASKRLVTLIHTVLAKKNKNPDALTQLVSNSRFQLLEKLAQAQPASSIEFFTKAGVFSEAKAHVLAGDDLSVLTPQCKNDLLGYFLKKKEYELAEKMLAAGADPVSHSKKFVGCIDLFLSMPQSSLHEYFILQSPVEGIKFIKGTEYAFHLNFQVVNPLLYSWQLYLDTPEVFAHTVTKVIAYLDLHWRGIDYSVYDVNLKRLQHLESVSSNVTKKSDLADQLLECRHRLVSSFAAKWKLTPLALAIQYDLSKEALEMVERGADLSDITINGKNLLLSLALAESQFKAAEMLIAAGANPNQCKN